MTIPRYTADSMSQEMRDAIGDLAAQAADRTDDTRSVLDRLRTATCAEPETPEEAEEQDLELRNASVWVKALIDLLIDLSDRLEAYDAE